jgi:hypothetical protein
MSEVQGVTAPVVESSTESTSAGQAPAQASGVSAQQAQAAVDSAKQNADGSFSIKVNGKERNVSLPEMKRLASLASGA